MVKGVDLFARHFAPYKDQYIIVTIPSETSKEAFLLDERYQYSKPWLTQELLEKNYDNYFMYQ